MDLVQMKKSTLKAKKLNDIQNIHLNKKKYIDFVDTIYKEAVLKLKYLLAESYSLKPTIRKPLDIKGIYQISNIKIVEPKQEAIKKCIIDNSELKNVHRNIVTDLQALSPELIIEQQKEYIQQLEQESQFCRKQLINLLYNVQEIITENETLHYKSGTELCKDTFDSYTTINKFDKSTEKSIQREVIKNKEHKRLESPKSKTIIGFMQEPIFEKCQYETEMKGFKKLDERHKKFNNITEDASKYIANKKRQIEQKHNQQDGKMSINTICHCNTVNKSQLEIEKGKKELTELRTELSQKEAFINNLKMEFQQEIFKQHGKEYYQEQNKFQLEIYSYKEQLDRANAELDQYRRENLKLSEQLVTLKEEININKYIYQDNLPTQILSKLENNKLTSMITDPVVKHEKVMARNVTRVGKVTSAPSKKRTVKLDLKIKVIPKQK
ncbi:uncharacterized protein LOC143423699 isoform X2 [Xylocopa sonorina]|uniref:uncharacterized protein LOC143423699 isoform X2 n=1 Tax=Xylocopa sonorina TaxID=1818115 RepID=UPI00403B1CF9